MNTAGTKVCLIRPPILCPKSHPIVQMTPPIGLAYVAAALKAEGLDVAVIDSLAEAFDTRHAWGEDCYLYGLGIEDILDRIDPATHVIGVATAFTFEWPVYRELIRRISARFADAYLIGGGEHITALPELCLNETPLDAAVLGEGEAITVQVVDALVHSHRNLSDIHGVAYRDADGKIVITPRHQRIRNLDDIPPPAWDLLPIERYLDRGYGFGVSRGRSMPVIASRGCPYQCTFCSNPLMWTTRWTARRVDDLLDELEHYQNRYGAENFDLYDLTAIVKKDWIVEFCDKIQERGLSFTWQLPSGTRSEAIDAEVARLLFHSGCRNMSYAPESGSETVLTRIKKKIRLDDILQSVDGAVRAGLNIKVNLMFGFPGETWREISQSFGFICKLAWAGAHDLSIWAFSPYPGSELFADLQSRGKIEMTEQYYNDLRSYSDISQSQSFSEHISDGMLRTLRWAGTVLFYVVAWLRRPWRPFGMVFNVLRGKQESRSELALASFLRRMSMKTNGK
ncbi:MAG: B12-binding domain-containing radical SAM protein [Alphaproteobacteria bacterium]|nr:B12-binding domain-containing radical SAM protein [Alphaproteobacteria bacterium]